MVDYELALDVFDFVVWFTVLMMVLVWLHDWLVWVCVLMMCSGFAFCLGLDVFGLWVLCYGCCIALWVVGLVVAVLIRFAFPLWLFVWYWYLVIVNSVVIVYTSF